MGACIVIAPIMASKRPALIGALSRDRTADMLRRLRELTRQVRMLKATIETERRKADVPRIRRPR